ncbi:MAG: hypothetical protein HC884_02560 [Chloroflexaceae bacterium]|nr:hypothetical protein [Chloroflexaceae bacterium]
MHADSTRVVFPSSGVAEVPLIFEPKVLRFQAAGPGGDPMMVLLDTGTDPSAIDLGLARRLGLPLGEFAMGYGAATNAIPFTETMLPWLRIGPLTLRNLSVLALDLQAVPFQVDVVLGYNVLWQVVVHIDYERRVIRLSHPDLGLPVSLPPDRLLPLAFFEHFPALTDVTLGQELHLPLVTIDTGSNGGLSLGPDLAQRLGLHRASEGVTVAEGAGFGGCCEVLRGEIDSLLLGPFTLHRVEIDTPGEGTGDLSRHGRANMGNSLLSRFASVTLDYGRRVCGLGPRAGTT